MSSALIEFSVKFNVLKSCVVDVRAERRDRDVKEVTDKEYRRRNDITDPAYACGEESHKHLANLIDDESDDTARKAETEQTRIRKYIADDIHAVIEFAESAEQGCENLDTLLPSRVEHDEQKHARTRKTYADPFENGEILEDEK